MIEVKNLTKNFGTKVAVDRVSFQVKKGEVLGFLGPNGAGKSTTMRMITGFIPPSEGEVSIAGKSIFEDEIAAKAKIGYLPESAPLYNDMNVKEFLAFAAEMRGIHPSQEEEAIERVIEMCFLQPVVYQSIDTLSKGYRHRTCLAQALIHDPVVLILDEPTDVLDTNQKHEVRGFLRDMGLEKAIIFSTHILEEVEAACTRAIIIDRGKVIANGTPMELKSRSKTFGAVKLRAHGEGIGDLLPAVKGLSEVGLVSEVEAADHSVTLEVHPSPKGKNSELGPALYRLCVDKNLTLDEMSVEKGQLDEVFRSLTTTDAESDAIAETTAETKAESESENEEPKEA